MKAQLQLPHNGFFLKIMAVLLVLCLTLPFAALAEPMETGMKEKACQVLREQLGLGEESVTYEQGGKFWEGETPVWSFTFVLKEHPEDEDGLILVDFSLDGALLSVTTSQKISLHEQLTNDYFQRAWPYSLEDLYEIKQKWEPRIPELESSYAGSRQFLEEAIRRLRVHISLPTPQEYPPADARRTAKDVILSLPGWTEEKFRMYPLYLEVFYDSQEVGRPIYQFVYSREDCTAGRFKEETWETYEQEYLQPLYALWGGTNETTPYYISVRLDGKTGKLVEDPLIAFPPVQVFELSTIR